MVVQISSQLIRFGKIKSLWIGNFRVSRVKIKKDGGFINGLRIVEMQNKGPLYEEGIKINDVIVSINNKDASWNNLISSLKFATLGEDLNMELINQKNEFISIEFKSSNTGSN